MEGLLARRPTLRPFRLGTPSSYTSTTRLKKQETFSPLYFLQIQEPIHPQNAKARRSMPKHNGSIPRKFCYFPPEIASSVWHKPVVRCLPPVTASSAPPATAAPPTYMLRFHLAQLFLLASSSAFSSRCASSSSRRALSAARAAWATTTSRDACRKRGPDNDP